MLAFIDVYKNIFAFGFVVIVASEQASSKTRVVNLTEKTGFFRFLPDFDRI